MKTCIILFSLIISFGSIAQGDIYLAVPADGELIEEKAINFVWQASSLGSQEDPRLSQELVVTEMELEQTAFEAIEINRPILNKSRILGASLYVSESEFPFEEGKKYAWQIRYYMNGVLMTRSEAWWFEIEKKDKQPREFVPIRLKSDGQIMTATDNALYLSLINKKEISLKAIIIDEQGKRTEVEFKEMVNNETVESGNTRPSTESRNFILEMQALKLEKGVYTLRWKTNKESDYTLLFKII